MKANFNKLTKGALIFSFLLVVFSFFYYYVIFLPQKEEARLEQQKQEQLVKEQKEQTELVERCREAGEKAYNSYKNNNKGVDYFFDPEFKFNKELNTCIYSGGYSSGNFWERFVKDTFTERTIIMTFNFRDKEDEKRTDQILLFWEKYEKLFTE